MKRFLLTLGVIGCIVCTLSAQMLKPVPVLVHANIPQKTLLEIPVTGINFGGNISYSSMPLIFHFKYELPKGAIFCRMEEALYNKLNFWVKIRTGVDEK